MEACSNYNEHTWKKNVCRNCFQKKHDHSSVQATATTDSTVSSSTSDIKPNSLSTNQPDIKLSKHDDELNTTLSKHDDEHNTTLSKHDDELNTTLSKHDDELNTTLSKHDDELNTTLSKHDDEHNTTLSKTFESSPINKSNTFDTTKSDVLSTDSNREDIHPSEQITCRYGINCYSQNPTHFQRYSHPPGFRAESVATNQCTDVLVSESMHPNKVIPCRYGTNCYSRNPTHFQQYSHPPGFRAESVATNQYTDVPVSESMHPSKVIPCRYGVNCYSRNPTHFQQYSHPPGFILIEQQSNLEKHLRLAEECYRTSMTNSEVKLKDYEGQIETLQRNLNAMAEYHQQLEHALGDELDKRERRELEQKRILSIKRDTPSYWGTNAFEQPFREINIHKGSVEFNIISDLLNDTIASHDHKYGTVYRKDPTEFIVTKLRRVQNDKLWHEYCFKKEQIIQRNNHNLKTCASSKYLEDHPFLTPLLDTDSNEYWLFHGCDRAIVPFLLHSGYDPRVSSLSGMFGGGFYLAENSSKSNQYIPCPGCGANAIFTDSECKCQDQENIIFSMLLYRAVLGDVHVAQIYDKKKYKGEDKRRRVRRPPLKDNGIDIYDSVLGESVKHGGDRLQYREVILYECGQAYPEYVIEFRRSATNAKPSRGLKHVKERCFDFFRNTFKLRPE